MRLEDLDYDLPPEAIAQVPLADRSASKLLWLDRDTGEIQNCIFRDVAKILRAGDLLVMNDTRVTALRVHGYKSSGGKVELLLLRELSPGLFEALAKPAKRVQPGTLLTFGDLTATVESSLQGGRRAVRFQECEDLGARLEEVGAVPLPPYITQELLEKERYQTVYARSGGSAAAPTAGLHFTPELLQHLREIGVETAHVTLDVGIDTFRPVTSENPLEHQIHGETCRLPEETAEAIRRCQGRIIGVGTTSVRTLESFAVGKRRVEAGTRSTKLFITPGFEFRVVDGMFTNFHMPRTTMLLMIGAMAGRERIMAAYEHALGNGYRFLSFGDSMLILSA